MEQTLFTDLWLHLLLPLLRIIFFIAVGLVIANLIESMKWTNQLAVAARPLIRMGRLSSISGASFSLAFVSGVSANTMLAEALEKGQLQKKEMVLANLFNSLPRYFLHLPTVFFLTVPLIKGAAIIYVAITFLAALLQTLLVVIIARFILPHTHPTDIDAVKKKQPTFKEAIVKSLKRLKKRIRKIALFLIPAYILFFLLGKIGVFDTLEGLFASTWLLSWLPPQSLGIVILHVTTEFSAGLAAASMLLADNSLTISEVVLALLVGNILAAPVRALRHQLPYYLGIFPKTLAIELVAISQIMRTFCVIIIGCCYYMLSKL